MNRHPQAALAALVDGELDHNERERTLAHLAHCRGCRAEVEAQRLCKARLTHCVPALPPPDLAGRLLTLADPSTQPRGPDAAQSATRALSPTDARAVHLPVDRLLVSYARTGTRRPPSAAGGRRDPRRPAGRGSHWSRRAVGGAVLAFGLGAVLAVGGPHSNQARPAVDPASDSFVVDYAATSGKLPLPETASLITAGAR